MTLDQILPVSLTIMGLSIMSTLAVIAVATTRRGRGAARFSTLLAPCRRALIAMASGEDEDGDGGPRLAQLVGMAKGV
jgi:hypothetical protein